MNDARQGNRTRRSLFVALLAAASLLTLSGCMGSIDTSGTKPPRPVTQADYARQIQGIQSDPKMPQGVKDGLIARVKAQQSGVPVAPPHP